MRSMPWLAALGLLVVMAPGAGHAIPRDRIVANGLAYGGHVWTPSAENVAVPAPCSNDWEPRHVAGQQYTGLPYDWGGYVTLPQFDADLAEGLRAGSYPSEGILECTTGVDCSGFVSQAWEATHHGTSTMFQIAQDIALSAMEPGDAFNIPGTHVILFRGKTAAGTVKFCHSIPSVGVECGIAAAGEFTDYTPIRYNFVDPDGVGTGAGSIDSPIEITSFPFEHDGNTANSDSLLLDRYSCAPNTSEAGGEVVYRFTVAKPGTLDVSTGDEAGVDVDIHLLTSPDQDHCLIRNNKVFSYELPAPGTYYIVADTYVDVEGVSYEGPYHLSVAFAEDPNWVPPDPGPEADGPEPMPDTVDVVEVVEVSPDVLEPEDITASETTGDIPVILPDLPGTDTAVGPEGGDKSGGGGCSAGTAAAPWAFLLLLPLCMYRRRHRSI